eukprot:11025203-Alexandrium_andersonii.AAC.1
MLPSVRHEGFRLLERGQRSYSLLTRSDRLRPETSYAAGTSGVPNARVTTRPPGLEGWRPASCRPLWEGLAAVRRGPGR